MAETMLSEAGVRRREAMRAMLAGAVVRRRRRRGALRAAACLLLLGVGLRLTWPQPPRGQTAARSPVVPAIRVIHDDPSVLARLSSGGPVARVVFLDDAALFAELRKDGRQAGLIRHAGCVELLPRIDDDWQPAQ